MSTDPTVSAGDIQNQQQFNELLFKTSAETEKINQLLQERTSILMEGADALESQTRTLNAILDNAINIVPEFENIRQLTEDARKEYDKQLEINREQLRLGKIDRGQFRQKNQEMAAILRQQIADAETINAQHKKRMGFLISEFNQGKKLESLGKLRNKEGVKYVDLIRQATEEGDAQKLKDLFKEITGLNKEFIDLQNKLEGVSSKVAGQFGLKAKFSDTSLGNITNMVVRISQMEQAGALTNAVFSKIFGQSFNLLNLFGSMVDMIKDMVIELDAVGKKLGAVTGMGNVFQSQIMTTFSATIEGGASMEESSNAVSALAMNFSKFNPAAEDVNSTLATTVVRLEKIGVSGAKSTKVMDHFVRTLRMTEKEASDLTVQISLLGQKMGRTSDMMITDFESVSGYLAIFGKDAITVFEDLAAQSKATGVEISKMVEIAKEFDTFEKAAEKTAMLNAVLGTNLSSIEMMNLRTDERIEILRRELQFSVGNLDNLDQYTQQLVAQQLGVSSVAEAQKLLNMTEAERFANQQKMDAAAKTQEELARLTEELVPVTQKFKIALMQLAVAFSPLIKLFAILMDVASLALYPVSMFAKAIEGMPATIILVVAGLYALGAAILYFGFTVGLANIGLTTMKMKMLAAFFVFIAAGFIMKKTDGVMRALALGALVLGTAMIFLGKSSIKVSLILAAIAAVLGMRINPLFIHAFSFLAVGVLLLAGAFAVLNYTGGSLALPLLAAMFASIALMVGAVYMLSDSLGNLFETLANAGAGLSLAGVGLYVIAGGLLAIGAALYLLGPLGLIGLVTLAASLAMMGLGLEKISTGLERISKLSTSLSGLGDNGLIAISSDGASTSAVMGTGDVFQNFSGGKMEVEVKMPEMKTPKFDLKVFLQGRELEAFVEGVVDRKFGEG